MSTKTPTEDETSGPDSGEPLIEQELTLIAYPSEDTDTSWREFAELTLPGTDWYAQKHKTRSTHYIVLPVDDPDHDGDRVEVASAEQAKDIASRRSDITYEEDIEEYTRDKHSQWDFNREFRSEFLDSLPDEVGEFTRDGSTFYLGDEQVGSITVSVESRERRLKHRDERTDDDRYEGPGMTSAVRVVFSLGEAPKSDVESLKDDLIPEAMTTLGRWSNIEVVRLAACTVQRDGDCFV